MTRDAEVFLAGVSAKHLTDKLAQAGFVFMRRHDEAGSETQHLLATRS